MKTVVRLAMGLFILIPLAGPAGSSQKAEWGTAAISVRSAPRLEANFGRIPLSFISNQGQLDRRVDYYVMGKDRGIFFTSEGITISLRGAQAGKKPGAPGDDKGAAQKSFACVKDEGRRWNVALDFVGANRGVHPVGEAKTDTVFSYFKGRPQDWRAGIPAYSRLVYRNLWPGVDLVYSGTSDRLKYEFIVEPGADPSKIRLSYRGVTNVSVNAQGKLQVETPFGGFSDEAPIAYQLKGDEKTGVEASFRLKESARKGAEAPLAAAPASRSFTYGFEIGDYDRSRPLILDPATVVYCGFIGGSADDRGAAVAIDALGNAYVTGWTASYDFPVTVGPDLTFKSVAGGTDAFVAKVNAAGTDLVYCGFIGGSRDDVGSGIAVDASGNAYVTGWTYSQDFPAVFGPGLSPHGNISQYSDAFVTKVNAAGTGLAYSGFVGGSLDDRAEGIAVDASGNAYLAGWTESTDFPAKTGPHLVTNGGQDAFIAKVNAAGTGFVYAGYIGGTADDGATAIAIDGSGNAYVTGFTNSYPTEHFPVTVGPFLTYGGSEDAFVAKVNAAGTGLAYCGYIGGTGVDIGAGIAVDSAGNAYVAGTSGSGLGFPATGGPSLVHHAGNDAFVAEVAASGTALVYCGFIGGSGDDQGTAIAVDASGIAYVAGSTDSSADFPVTGGPYLVQSGLKDAFVATVSASGDSLIYCGYLGGSQNDEGEGIAADGVGNVFVTGYTRSNDFPVSVGPFLIPGAGPAAISDDAFIVRLSENLPPAAPANLHATTVTATEIDIVWTDKSTNEDGFKIERKTGATGTWSQIATVGANVTIYKDISPTEGTTYVYRVRAYNAVGNSGYSNEATILTRPAAPTNLAATVINERQINLFWTNNSASESGFRIERTLNPNGSWAAVGTVAANVTTFADTTVLESTTYYYRVLAFNSGGDSDPSNVVNATTPALTVPVAPSGLQATALSANQVRLTWVDNSFNEAGFEIERKTGAGGAYAQVGTAGANLTTAVDSGLTESTTYYYRVRAYNNAGDSGYSNEAPVTTPANLPQLRLPIADIAFGSVNECSSLDRTTVLYNDGGVALTVTSIAPASGSADFSYRGPATPFSVPALGSQIITLRYAPLSTGPAAAVFAVHSNDAANPSATFGASGTGFVPAISLSLMVERKVEKAWIISREYGRITLTVTKSAPFNVTTYRLSRRTGTGSYETIKDFTEADLTAGTVTYLDLFLATGTSYNYKVDALDCGGAVLATSSGAGTLSSRPTVPKRETQIIKR